MSKTFADIAKTIRKRFEGRESDPVAMRTMEAQMQKLMEANEMAKSEKEENEEQLMEEARKWGGSIKYAKGGKLVIDKAHKNDMIDAGKARGMGVMSYAKELSRVAEMRSGGNIYEDGGTLSERYMLQNGGPWDPFTDVNNVYNTAEMNLGTEYADYMRGNGLLEGFLNRGDLDLDTFKAEAQGLTGGIRPDVGNLPISDPLARQLGPDGISQARASVASQSTQPTLPPAPDQPISNPGTAGAPSRSRGVTDWDAFKEMNAKLPQNRLESKVVSKDRPMNPTEDPTTKTYSSKSAATAAQKKYNLPDMPEYTTKTAGEGVIGDPANNKSASAGTNAIDPKWGAVASAVPYLADMITAGRVDKTKLKRLDLDELDLTKQRQLTRRDSAIGRLMARKNVRQNANSSGQAISAIASQNAAITDAQIRSDLQSYIQEETTNTQIRNQEEIGNQQIDTQETIINEQNQGVSDSNRSQALHGISGAVQGSIKDTNLTAENLRYNESAIEIMNQMSPNYQWGTDPETEAWVLQFVQKQQG